MDIYFLEHLSAQKTSFLHRLSIGGKLTAFFIFLTIFVFMDKSFILLGAYLFLLLIMMLARLPFFKLFVFSLYPAVFVIIFAFNVPAVYFIVIVLKVLGASMLAVLLVSTTSHFKIFRALSFILPSAMAQIMFIAYRSVFIILNMLSIMFSAMKLRGGIDKKNLRRTISVAGNSFGYLFVRSADMAERMNDITYLRGFDL